MNKKIKKEIIILIFDIIVIITSYQLGWLIGNKISPKEVKVPLTERAEDCRRLGGTYEFYNYGYGNEEKCRINIKMPIKVLNNRFIEILNMVFFTFSPVVSLDNVLIIFTSKLSSR